MEAERAWTEDEDGPLEPTFLRSLDPTLAVDDERRILGANRAACLFLRLSPDGVRELTIDDLEPPGARAGLTATWDRLISGGAESRLRPALVRDMRMPDGTTVEVGLRAMAHVRPGRHLAIIGLRAIGEPDERLGSRPPLTAVLTAREREILTLVAAGCTGVEIAARLFLAPTTVQTHVTNALIKLGAKNRAHGVAIALRLSQLDLDETGAQPRGLGAAPARMSRSGVVELQLA